MSIIKKLGIVSILILSIAACRENKTTDRFAVEPLKPEAGNVIEVLYNPAGTALQNAQSIEVVYYVCIPGKDEARSTMMRRLNGTWTASLNIEETVLAAAFKFVSNGASDSNGDKGYTVLFCDDHGNPVAGSRAALGNLLVSWREYVEVIRTRSMKTNAMNGIKGDIENNPELRKYYLSTYYYLLKDLKTDEGVKEITADITKHSAQSDLPAEEISAMLPYCEGPDMQSIKSSLVLKLKKLNPKDEYFLSEKAREYLQSSDFAVKEQLVNDIAKNYPGNEYTAYLQTLLVDDFVRNGKEIDAAKYIKSSIEYIDPGIESHFATVLSENPGGAMTAAEFAKSAVDRKQSEMKDGIKAKPSSITANEWSERQNAELGTMLGVYGKALMLNLKTEEALPVLERALTLTGSENAEINEYYCNALLGNKEFQKVLHYAEKCILDGTSTPEMTKMLEKAYIEVNKNSSGFRAFIAGIESKAKENRISRIKSEMLNKPAPDFTLTDLNGKTVSLKDFKGKSLMVDFWATWCPPCRASFPFLKKLVEGRKSDDTVRFIFINTRDHEQNRQQRVAKFLKDNDYPFYVLLDTENDKTNDEYVIPGLPTKLFIDKNGIIRFMMVGWEGEEEKESERISTILELIK